MIVLFLHGGPGSFESLFAYELDEIWGDMFTHVHWDQRGAGKTLRRNKKTGMPESVEQMLDDLHGVVGYLQRKYHTNKVVILGHSWGSLLGSLYALRYPQNVLSYIGLGEMLKTIRRSPSFQWGDLISFMRIMKVNRPLHLQMLSFNLCDSTPQYNMPVHYILGEADTIAPTSLGKAYYDMISAPGKSLTIIPDAGHNPMYERPDEFAAALRAVRETL